MTKHTVGETLDLLLVEDNPGDARLLQEYLSEAELVGAEPGRARSLEAALDRLRNGDSPPDVVLLDLGLPDASGLEAVKAVLEAAPDLPVVVVTGRDDRRTAVDALRAGAEDYLLKGEVGPEVLARSIRYAVERRRAEAELRRQERRFRALISNLSDVISVIASDGTVRYESPSVEAVLGYAPEELEGENVLEYVHPEDRDRVRRELGELGREPGGEAIGEARFRHADGSWRVLEARGRMPPEATELDGVILVSRDVTERVERERELERTTASLRERVKEQSCLYDVSQLLHADERPFGERLQGIADRLLEGWQYPETAAARLRLEGTEWTTGGFAETEWSLTAPITADGDRIGEIEVCYLDERPEEEIGPFIREEQTLLKAIAAQIGLVVERRRTRRELEAERARLAEVFETVPTGIVISDPESGELLEMNEAFEKIFKAPLKDMLGHTSYEMGHWENPDRRDQIVERVRREGAIAGEEAGFRTMDGERRRMRFSCRQIQLTGDEALLWAVQDVTEERERREWLHLLEEAVGAAGHGMMVADREGAIEWVNPAVERMTGYEKKELVGENPRIFKSEEQGQAFYEDLWQTVLDGEVWEGELVNQRKDGSHYVERQSIVPIRHRSEEITHFIAVKEDITREKEREEALRRSEARYRTLVETMAEATVILKRDGRITFANEAAEELLGLEESEIPNRTYADPEWTITAPEGAPFPEEKLPFRQVMDTGRPVREVEHAIERADGSRRILSVNAAPVAADDETLEGVVATMRDVTERYRMEAELRHQALHDSLTGLPNRTLFEDRLEQALERSHRHGHLVGLIMLDVDRFKRVNDQYGHAVGDRLLTEVAERLQSTLRGEDTGGRLGGDEFGILLSDLEESENLTAVRNRLMRTLEEPYRLGGELAEVAMTFGCVLHGGDEVERAVTVEEPDDLLRYADLALYRAKETRGPSFHLFHPGETSEARREFAREQELRRAFREEEFELRWQPIIRLLDGTLRAVEPLARWRHPEHGMLSPASFIPLAEETGLIQELGELLFRQVCREAADWPGGKGSLVQLTPNLSAGQLEEIDLASTLRQTADEVGLEPDHFWLEITETEIVRATEMVERLRSLGFGVFVDDFGTGYSSFHYLRDYQLDGLKIDMSFVQQLGRDEQSKALIKTMLTMARALEMDVVAEGIETEEQEDILLELGCDLGQGYLFARPMTSGKLVEQFAGKM